MRIDRYHGLGNDYLVTDTAGWTPARVVALCDRHTGVGGDGLLQRVPVADGVPAEHGVVIWNPDGSVAEKSGNGLRIYAQWLVDRGLAGPHQQRISTGPCQVVADVLGGGEVVVDMGQATTVPVEVPVLADAPVLGDRFELGEHGTVDVVAVGVGNPHAVVFVEADDLDALPWRTWGQALEVHPRFPRRTNVQVAAVRGPGKVEIRIWERGAGPTSASGSSSCGVVVAAVTTGRLSPGRVRVPMPGGELTVDVDAGLNLRLQGPVECVGSVTLDSRWVARVFGAGQRMS